MRSPPAKKLAKGDAVAVDSEGHKVQLESVATIQKIAHRSYHLGIFRSAPAFGKRNTYFENLEYLLAKRRAIYGQKDALFLSSKQTSESPFSPLADREELLALLEIGQGCSETRIIVSTCDGRLGTLLRCLVRSRVDLIKLLLGLNKAAFRKNPLENDSANLREHIRDAIR